MKKGGKMLDYITENAGSYSDTLPGMPLVELIGYNRILIENHKGVCTYCANKISINVSYGQLCICGSCLNITYMSRQRLVITGTIENVSILTGRVQ